MIHGVERGLGPEEFGAVEHRALEVDVDAEDEERADLHGDLAAGEGDVARGGELGGEGVGLGYGCGEEVFEEGGLEDGC